MMGKGNNNLLRLILIGFLFGTEASILKSQPIDAVPDLTAGVQTFQVDLPTVLKLAGADNLTIQEFKTRQDLAILEEKVAREWLFPELFLGVSLHDLNGSAMNSDGKFFREVDRNELWAGAGIGLNWIPGEGIYQTLAAKQHRLASGHLLQARKNEAILNAILVFYDLQEKQAEFQTQVSLLNYTDRISKQMKIQVDHGQLYRSEYLLARSNYNNTLVALQEVIKDVHRLSAELMELLNIEDEEILLLSSVSDVVPVELLDEQMIALGLYDSAYSRRPELRYHQTLIEARKFERQRLTRGLLIPQLSLTLTDGAVGPFSGVPNNDPTDFTGRYENTLDINAMVGWSIPLDLLISGGQRKKVDALIQLQQNHHDQQKNLIRKQVSQAFNEYRESKNQLRIARESAEFVEEALKQSTERQKLGTAKPFEVFQAQEIYLKTTISYQNVVSNYNKSQYRLYVAMGNDL